MAKLTFPKDFDHFDGSGVPTPLKNGDDEITTMVKDIKKCSKSRVAKAGLRSRLAATLSLPDLYTKMVAKTSL